MEVTSNKGASVSFGKRAKRFGQAALEKQEIAILIPFLVLFALFFLRNPAMANPNTLQAMLRTMAFPALIAMGMVQLMIAGEIDLSTGAVMSLAAVFSAKLIRDMGVPIPLAVLCAMGVSLLVGLLNALFTVKVGIPAVITTIGMQFIVRGVSYSFTSGLPIYPLPKAVGTIGSWRPLGLSFTFLLMLALVIIVQILISRTRWGSSLFATGSNPIAAEICGISTFQVKTICFMLTSFLAGVAGMLTMSQIPGNPGDPVIGRNLEFDVLAGIIIGGVSFYGGRGSAVGAFIGVMFIQLVRNGLIIAHFSPYLATPSLGILMTIAASVDVLRHRRSEG